uniref:Uncharacterized protein n=1 Tax=Mus musculus TaxID=10090 RepID=Q8BUB2_MOUSE|nr:unnamed protein product [Mus musculus]
MDLLNFSFCHVKRKEDEETEQRQRCGGKQDSSPSQKQQKQVMIINCSGPETSDVTLLAQILLPLKSHLVTR